jgi:hypothetical protein
MDPINLIAFVLAFMTTCGLLTYACYCHLEQMDKDFKDARREYLRVAAEAQMRHTTKSSK